MEVIWQFRTIVSETRRPDAVVSDQRLARIISQVRSLASGTTDVLCVARTLAW